VAGGDGGASAGVVGGGASVGGGAGLGAGRTAFFRFTIFLVGFFPFFFAFLGKISPRQQYGSELQIRL